MQFIDRVNELKQLEEEYQKATASLVILYGRRRLGKTFLCSHFLKSHPGLYFLATEENENQNRNEFKKIVASFTKNDLLNNVRIDNWEILFKELVKHSKKKIVIVIDEFQYLGKSNPAFPSIFQKIWDTLLSKENIMVILCGSLIHMMESQTLNYNSPLYGRRTAQIRLKPIPFLFYQEFYPDFDKYDLVQFYSVTGGVPKYIELFKDKYGIYKSIENNILNPSSFLYDEPNFLLRNEVSEVGSYFSILKTIASNNHKLSKIASILEIEQTKLPKYLKTLIDLDILQREVPITETNPEKSKKGLYKIKDNYILFWFQFIYPYRAFIESGHPEIVMKKIKDNFIDNHVSFIYEDICKEQMWQLSSQDKWPFYFQKVGRWWDKNTEIDLVALDEENKNIVFGECKYTNKPVGINILNELKEKATKVTWNKDNRNEYYILFSISGFTQELLDLADNTNNLLLCR